MNTLVLYHQHCTDGFAAAYAAWKHFGSEANYKPFYYTDETPLGEYDRVYFLDVTPEPIDRLEEIASQVGGVVIIDHHKTSMEEFAKVAGQFKNVEAHFNMSKSAAVLAWEYFHPNQPIPWLFSYIQDHDLWKNQLPNTKEVNAYMRIQKFGFGEWDDIVQYGDGIQIVDLGKVVLATEQHYYRQTIPNRVQWWWLGQYRIPVINNSVDVSSATNELLQYDKGNLKSHIAGYYFDKGRQRQWGLRGDGTIDVGELARQMGGGGHQNSAGFVTRPEPLVFGPGSEPVMLVQERATE